MAWLRQNYKAVIGTLVILILTEAVIVWYLIRQFHENYLSGEKAAAIALADARLKPGEAQSLDIRLKTKRGDAWYTVTFETRDTSEAYEYRVDAESGNILFAHKN